MLWLLFAVISLRKHLRASSAEFAEGACEQKAQPLLSLLASAGVHLSFLTILLIITLASFSSLGLGTNVLCRS